MKQTIELEPCMVEALAYIDSYIDQTLGEPPTPHELASALKRFFVLKEIREFIEMERAESPES